MYSASQEYWKKINEQDRTFELRIRIEHEGGTLHLTDKDIGLGSFKLTDSTQAGEEFTVGGIVASHLEFTLVNKDKFKGINLIGAKVVPTIKLFLREAIDAHFMQPSQPSKMIGFEDEWEHIPLGQFNIDIADRLRSTIEVKAIDNMILLDKPYSLSTINYPATLGRILNDICNIAGIGSPVGTFVNSDYVVKNRPAGDYTLRNIVGFIAELSGSFAKFDRTGRLGMKWYEDTDIEITSHQRIDLEQSDYSVKITGVRFDSDEKDENDNEITYLVGTEEYMVDLTGNELLQGDYEIVLPKILSNIEGISFTPYSASWQGNPAIDAGDILTHIDLDGVRHRTIVTNNKYAYRGISTMAAKALPNISRGFKSSDNRIASIIGRVEADIESELSSLQQEQLRATELIGNMLGGHVSYITEKDEIEFQEFGSGIFIHDAPNLQDSTKVWKWGIGGFGFSDDGGESYNTGVTIDGSIVANIISANHINTGTLTSNKGNSWISMDTGEFELGGMKLIDNEFSLTLSDIDLDGNMLSDTITTINATVNGVETSVKSYSEDLVSGSETRIMQTVDGISSTVSTINANYATTSQITQLSGEITSKVSKTDFTGYNMSSIISQSPSGINLIASKITLSANNIDLDGITRVNKQFRVGKQGQVGEVVLGDNSSIKSSGSGYSIISTSIENRIQCSQLHLVAPNIYFNSEVSVSNSPFVRHHHSGNSFYLDYGHGLNYITVRNRNGTRIGTIPITPL